MTVKRNLPAAVLIAIVVAIFVVRSLPDEKKRFAADISALVKAVERRDEPAVLGFIDSGYVDEQGLDFPGMEQAAGMLFKQVTGIKVTMSKLNLRIDSVNAASVRFASCSLGLRITGRANGDQILIFGGLVHPAPVRGYFRKGKDRYRLYSARY